MELAFEDPCYAVKLAFEITTGKPVESITNDDQLPNDRVGFFARLTRYQRVLMIDVITAKTVGELSRVLVLKRNYPHVEPVEGESEVRH